MYHGGSFARDLALVCDERGRVVEVVPAKQAIEPTRLERRALLPGMVNAHSHAFQRVIRGRTEYRTTSQQDSFWTWRELMYRAANQLSPEDVFIASRMAFLEMALNGITTVGEFHYLHNDVDGAPYDDSNLLAKQVVRAAEDIGIRIALLRVAYARAGYQKDPNPFQARFIESLDAYLKNTESLLHYFNETGTTTLAGIAPHSVRAVPLDDLRRLVDFAGIGALPIHMHVAEQQAEVSACIEEYGRSPIELLETEGLLNERFTAVHAIYVSPKDIASLARSRASVCACPTTERNLGDGVVPVDSYFEHGVQVSLGSDSQAQIDLLEDARELEYHLRLQRSERNVLAPRNNSEASALATRLFDCATANGAASLGFDGGTLKPNAPADFFTIDLDDPTVAGASQEDLLSSILFSSGRLAIKDVVVGGSTIVSDGRHASHENIIRTFDELQKRLWDS